MEAANDAVALKKSAVWKALTKQDPAALKEALKAAEPGELELKDADGRALIKAALEGALYGILTPKLVPTLTRDGVAIER